MLPRATARDDRRFGAIRRGASRAQAWWRSRALGVFVVGHCVLAGAVQLLALVADLARAGRDVPDAGTMAWAWLGLALIATIPALVTSLLALASSRRTHVQRVLTALGIGAGFYVVPVLLLFGSLAPMGAFVPVATIWHATLAFAPNVTLGRDTSCTSSRSRTGTVRCARPSFHAPPDAP
jgi:hypothetical protein